MKSHVALFYAILCKLLKRNHLMKRLNPRSLSHQVGGLGDVVTGLGRALQKRGHRVEIIIPKYKSLDMSCVKNFKVCLPSLSYLLRVRKLQTFCRGYQRRFSWFQSERNFLCSMFERSSRLKTVQRLNKHFYSYFEGAMHKNVVWTGVVEGNPSLAVFSHFFCAVLSAMRIVGFNSLTWCRSLVVLH